MLTLLINAIFMSIVANVVRIQHRKACQLVIKKRFSLKVRIVRINHIGLPRSGKTCFRRRLMGEIVNIMLARLAGEPSEQPSTGVAEDGGQVIIRHTCKDVCAIRAKVWSTLKDLGDEANVINQFIYEAVQESSPAASQHSVALSSDSSCDGSVASLTSRSTLVVSPSVNPSGAGVSISMKTGSLSISPSTATASTTSSSLSINPSTDTPANASPSTPRQSWWKRLFKKRSRTIPIVIPTVIAEEEDDIDEGMFSVINEAMEAEDWDQVKYLLEDTTLVINTDTGGHAEFLDLQASLVQGPSFNLLFSRLVDQLDSLFKIYYTNEESVSTDKEDSTMTVEEVLFQALSSIACFSGSFTEESKPSLSRPSKSKVMFVGTHRDMVSEEDFKTKDEFLRKKIEGTEFYNRDIIEFAAEDQLMLAVDNMNGGQDEIDQIHKIFERVIEKNFEKISIPAAWLVLSLYIRSRKVNTTSLSDCEKLAGKLKINPEELQDALWFLHHHAGVLLYYPEVDALKDTIICQMQVVFDSTSNIIKKIFTFDEVGQRASKEFREKGKFALKDVKESHTDSLIPLEKLVMLLQYLSVLTPIPSTPSADVNHTQEIAYFMPCVLQSARASELHTPSSSDRDPAPLLLRYDCGYVPVGVFPCLITNLVSQQLPDWRIIEEGLRKNRVQFHVGDDYDTVTLISHPRYFEIAISRNEDFETPTAALCDRVRSVFQSTLDVVTSRMNYHFSMGYKFGFECPTHPGREHLCVLARESVKRMECLQNPKKIETILLASCHSIWFSTKITQRNLKTPFIIAI